MKRFVLAVLFCLSAATAQAQCRVRCVGPAAPVVYATPSATYVEPVVIKKAAVVEKVVEKIVPFFPRYVAIWPILEFPTYGTQAVPGYQFEDGPGHLPTPAFPPRQPAPQNPPGAAPQSGGELRQILELLQKQDARLRVLEEKILKTPAGAKKDKVEEEPSNAPLPDVNAVLTNKCAGCHKEGNEQHGAKFVLLTKDGKIVDLTNDQLLGMSERVYAGTMPPADNPRTNELGIKPLTNSEAGAIMKMLSQKRKKGASKKSDRRVALQALQH